LKDKLSSHLNKLDENETNLTSLSHEKITLAETNQDLSQKIEVLNAKIAAHESLLNDKETALAQLNTEKSSLNEANQSLKQQIDALNASLVEVTAENGKFKTDLETALHDKERLSSEIEAFKNDSGAKDVVDQLQKELTEALEKIDELNEK
jgi:chromosome segregation ATPase